MIGEFDRAIGTREARQRLRGVITGVLDSGQPVILLEHGAPRAVLISYAEAQRWLRIERASAVLHGLNIAPEAMRDTARIGEHILRDDRLVATAAVLGLAQAHEILEPIRTTGISDARERFAEILAEVYAGKPLTIVHGGQYAVVLISPREYDRLRRLSRPVGWFAGAGLDLATASDGEIRRFVDDYRARHGVISLPLELAAARHLPPPPVDEPPPDLPDEPPVEEAPGGAAADDEARAG
jgi:prevent-host-death family protein